MKNETTNAVRNVWIRRMGETEIDCDIEKDRDVDEEKGMKEKDDVRITHTSTRKAVALI